MIKKISKDGEIKEVLVINLSDGQAIGLDLSLLPEDKKRAIEVFNQALVNTICHDAIKIESFDASQIIDDIDVPF